MQNNDQPYVNRRSTHCYLTHSETVFPIRKRVQTGYPLNSSPSLEWEHAPKSHSWNSCGLLSLLRYEVLKTALSRRTMHVTHATTVIIISISAAPSFARSLSIPKFSEITISEEDRKSVERKPRSLARPEWQRANGRVPLKKSQTLAQDADSSIIF